jgi:SAM-dependent methyltransferase
VADKRQPLTEQDVSGYDIHPEIVRYLEECRQRLGLSPQQTRVLDWGCGRGEAVLWLRDRGYEARGIDIEDSYVERGRELLRQRGQDETVLQVIEPPAHTPFADEEFHYVFSDQVLEHVPELAPVLQEIARVTAADGATFHSFPADLHPVEDHLKIPFVHYLPKNRSRYVWVLLFVLLGRGPRWNQLEEAGRLARARVYYEYSVTTTYYRTPQQVQRAFAASGLEAQFVTAAKSSWRRLRVADWIARTRAGYRFVEWALLRFRSVEILARKALGSNPPRP